MSKPTNDIATQKLAPRLNALLNRRRKITLLSVLALCSIVAIAVSIAILRAKESDPILESQAPLAVAVDPLKSPPEPSKQDDRGEDSQGVLKKRVQNKVNELFAEANLLHDNPSNSDQKLQDYADQMNENEINIVGEIALNEKSPPETKTFSVYLLGLSKQRRASEWLSKLAALPISNPAGAAQVPEEILDREILVREMAINELADQSIHIDTAPLLHEVAQSTTAPETIRQTARRLLRAVREGRLVALRNQEEQLLKRVSGQSEAD